MSSYTAILLAVSSPDSVLGKVDELNTILDAYGWSQQFKGIGDTSVYGLSKNYLPVSVVVEAAESIEWNNPARLQCLVRSEYDDKFTELELHPNHIGGFGYRFMPDKNGPDYSDIWGTGRWQIERTPTPYEPVVQVSEDLLGRVDGNLVRLLVLSRLRDSAQRIIDYIQSLTPDEQATVIGIIERVRERCEEGGGNEGIRDMV